MVKCIEFRGYEKPYSLIEQCSRAECPVSITHGETRQLFPTGPEIGLDLHPKESRFLKGACHDVAKFLFHFLTTMVELQGRVVVPEECIGA